MDVIQAMADLSIRRACAFAALAVACVMVALSFDPVLSFRTGAELLAVLCLSLGIAAWRVPRRNLRHSELWSLLRDGPGAFVHRMPPAQAHALLAATLRRRLLWHAERIGFAALALWAMAALLALGKLLLR